MPIHPTAIVDDQAQVAASADIGPHVVIEGPVKIADDVKVYPNAYISGWTEIGAGCEIHPGAVVGHLPQDYHYGGERSYCRIGARTIIREFASIHRGTQPDSCTTLGEECFILGYAHIGHNCELGDRVKVYNCAALAGHVTVGANAILSGYSLIHQFVRIGEYVMLAGGSRLTKDLPPFFTAVHESECSGYNAIGLQRAGTFSTEEVCEVKEAYRLLYRSGRLFRDALEELRSLVRTKTGRAILAFLDADSKRGIIGGLKPRGGPTESAEAVSCQAHDDCADQ